MFEHASDTNDAPKRRKIKRFVVAEDDGTREGGLVFTIVMIIGFIGASAVDPLALTSFWVWFSLLMMSIAVAVGAQKLVARWNGHEPIDEEAEV